MRVNSLLPRRREKMNNLAFSSCSPFRTPLPVGGGRVLLRFWFYGLHRGFPIHLGRYDVFFVQAKALKSTTARRAPALTGSVGHPWRFVKSLRSDPWKGEHA